MALAGVFEPGESIEFDDVFSFLVAEDLPGDHVFEFELSAFSADDEETKWRSTFQARAYAPFLVFDDWQVDDEAFGNNNGRLDPGETATIITEISNDGMLQSDSVRIEVESLSQFLLFEQMEVYNLDSIAPGESEVLTWLVSALQETPLESPAEIALNAYTGVFNFNQNQPVIVGLAPVYTGGNIPTSYAANPSIQQEASNPGILTVNVPEGAVIKGVDVEYEITSQNGAWMKEQRSYIECTTQGGRKEKAIHAGTDQDSGGTVFYERNRLGIANNVEGGGDIEFKLHAFRTWGGSGSNTDYAFVNNNSWKVIVHYELQKYDVTLKLVNQFGEKVQDATIEIAGEVKNSNDDGEVFFHLNKGNHMLSIEAYNHLPVEFYSLRIEEEGLIEIPMERMLIANFSVTDIFDDPLEDAVIFVEDQEIESHVKYELDNGLYNYRVLAPEHQEHTGSFFVNNEDVDLNIKLIPYYSATFDIIDQWGNDVKNAMITLNNEDFTQSEINELVPDNYAFTISAPAFNEFQDEFEIVDDDVVVSVTLLADGTDVNDLSSDGFAVYPNPAKNSVMFTFQNGEHEHAVMLLNTKGQVLDQFKISGKQDFSYDLSSLESGVYFIQVVIPAGIMNKKLIVE